MSLELCRIVLIETHYPGNLGATARVMRNFGLRDLVLVAPVANRDDRNARQMSTHGEAILQNARIVPTLDEAIHDCVLVVGTSAKAGGRFRQQNVGLPREILPLVVDILRLERPTALLFGPESSGLSNDIVTRCHHLIQIPTADEYTSLNLAQAVAICVYELHQALHGADQRMPEASADLASVAGQEFMFQQLQAALEQIHFLYGDKADSLMHAIRHMLGKSRLTDMEVNVLLGLARQIRWYVDHHPDRL